MKRLFFVACAAFALTFASCSSNKAEQKATEAAQEATEQVQAQAEQAKVVVNEVLTAIQNKLNEFKTKVQNATKADVPALTVEATALKDEIAAATLTDDEKKGLQDTFNSIIELIKSLN